MIFFLSLRRYAPISRFSNTEMVGKIRRPSGTWIFRGSRFSQEQPW
jgi:hypothetical protein